MGNVPGLGGVGGDGDGASEGLEAADAASGQAFGVAALGVVAAEGDVGLAGGEHVPVGGEH
jgi:hypothetical protein